MRVFKTAFAFATLMILFYLLNFSHAGIPPMARFLNPFAGFWLNGSSDDVAEELFDVQGLRGIVRVVWDERQVPHVFAQNTYDLYFAQGYMTARHRLWQMEFQTHVAAGRVSEIVGPKALEFDRLQRRRGLLMGAEASINLMNEDAETQLILQAYANGVNSWIATLTPATLPLEYKLLDYEPETWSTLKTALLYKLMAWDLTGRNSEMDMSIIRSVMGTDFVDMFYPEDTPRTDPVIPSGKPWHFEPLKPDEISPPFEPQFIRDLKAHAPDPDNGSNNWAVSGKKTASGHPILANDPHLGLKLPSIWYEIQLNSPEMNVYGVSLPGAPAITIGFNDNIAWGLTNAGSDVMDWFEIEFTDDSYSRYRYRDTLLQASMRYEEIRVRGGETVLDSFPVTRFGNVIHYRTERLENGHPLGLAMRWAAQDASNEMRAAFEMNRASDLVSFYQAIDFFDVPGQNIAFASRGGDIAIRHNGKFPLRARDQGKFVRAGRDTLGEWRHWIPREQLPVISNPWRGFVSSANQNPVARNYPYYLGWDYDDFERGARINDELARMRRIRIQDMESLQLDVQHVQAVHLLPFLLSQLVSDTLTDEELAILSDLRAWDYEAYPESREAWVYSQWWQRLEKEIWADDLELLGELRKLPARSVTAEVLMKKRKLSYYDNRWTPEHVENRQEIIQTAFEKTLAELRAELGPYSDSWAIGRARGTDIKHLLSVKGLGRPGLETGGGPGIVNATKKIHGPSWRMVVELGDEVKAHGIFPGGQSGNPGSKFYDNAVDNWVRGNYYTLHFMQSAADALPNGTTTTILRNYQ